MRLFLPGIGLGLPLRCAVAVIVIADKEGTSCLGNMRLFLLGKDWVAVSLHGGGDRNRRRRLDICRGAKYILSIYLQLQYIYRRGREGVHRTGRRREGAHRLRGPAARAVEVVPEPRRRRTVGAAGRPRYWPREPAQFLRRKKRWYHGGRSFRPCGRGLFYLTQRVILKEVCEPQPAPLKEAQRYGKADSYSLRPQRGRREVV